MNKGIERLGIIASVIWLLAGGIWNFVTVESAGRDRVSTTYFSCIDSADHLHQSEEPCETGMRAGYETLGNSDTRRNQFTEALLGTLIPLVLAWVLAYVITWLGRWVIVGFRAS